jgi:hypothetical protein
MDTTRSREYPDRCEPAPMIRNLQTRSSEN